MKNYLNRLARAGAVDRPTPYVWVAHSQSTRLHLHLMLPRIDSALAESKWHSGLVGSESLEGVDDIRAMATYIGKEFAMSEPSRHRYSVGEGDDFHPERFCIPVSSEAEGVQAAVDLVGMEPSERYEPVVGSVVVGLRWSIPT